MKGFITKSRIPKLMKIIEDLIGSGFSFKIVQMYGNSSCMTNQFVYHLAFHHSNLGIITLNFKISMDKDLRRSFHENLEDLSIITQKIKS